MKKVKFKIVWIGVMVLMMGNIGFSQYDLGVRLGGFIGKSSSSLVDNILSLNWEAGPEIGFYAEKHIGNDFSIVSGLEYSKKGFSIDQGTNIDLMGLNLPIGARADFNLHYIETPLAIKYSIGQGKTKFYGILGASMGYATGGNIETTANLIVDFNISNIAIPFGDNNISRWNPSALVGAGVSYPVSNGKIFADVRYKHGLNSIISDTFLDVDLANRGFSIGIGYAINLSAG